MTTFSELPLSSALQRKLAASQFTNLTLIQQRTIPPALEGRDVIGTAQTGTGETLAFLIPLIETLDRESARSTVALVINYDVPKMSEDFIHRVGRSGRAGLQGCASTLAAGAEVLELRQIERTLKLKMERLQAVSETAVAPRRMIQNTLASRTLTALPGEVFA